MAQFDGSGALEARLKMARQKSDDSARAEQGRADHLKAARQARSDETTSLVAEFIAKARSLDIKPLHRLPAVVHESWQAGDVDIIRSKVIDGTRTPCWHLGGKVWGSKSAARPTGKFSKYFLSVDGRHMVEECSPLVIKSSFFSGKDRMSRTVRWVPTEPSVMDVISFDAYTSKETTLAEAMVEFFLDHEGA
ncbi:hypothetical protein [Paenarthrobacter sp. C1]|uniref:hypothetical protein n=1 Tax=Paenarthrobacter sp. C1 TaxID=3400220 RepID=UPI003BF5B9E2